jgi:hypothetical protein
MAALIQDLDHPENADLTILEKSNTTSGSSLSLTQMQVLKGVLIAVGVIGGLILLALGLQYLHH